MELPSVLVLSLLAGLASVHAQTATAEPCAAVSIIAAAQATDDSVLLPAEVAYQCLESVPLVEKDATDLLDGWAAFLEWQSDPAYKANPPDGYLYPGFDYMQAVYDLRNRVTSGNITRELDLQDGIQDILFNSNDGHLNFLTDFNSVIQFERQVGLVAVSVDGQAVPQVYTLADMLVAINGTSTYNPSPVETIDGQDVVEFLTSDYEKGNLLQDPDAQYNYQFYTVAELKPALVAGGFVFPSRYPGPSTSLTFANGTERSYLNIAAAQRNFTGVVDGPTFYDKFCNTTRKINAANREKSGAGHAAVQKRDLTTRELVERQSSPVKPVVASDDKSFYGDILTGSAEYERTAVIALHEFTSVNQTQVQTLLSQFLAVCRQQGVDHLVLDISSNGGGSIIVAYDIMKQLFPALYPYFMRTFRAHPQFEVLGEVYTNISIAVLAETHGNRTATLQYGGTSSYDVTGYVDRDGKYFPDWPAYYGPVADHDDKVTNPFTWDISDTAFSTSYASGVDYYAVTGYGQNTPAPPRPFDPANIVILSNGQCSSSCTTLSHFLKWQGKVKSLVMGGRPNTGPMQHPGGIKGGTVLGLPGVTSNAILAYQSGVVPDYLLERANKTKLVELVKLSDYLTYRTSDPKDASETLSVNFANSVLGSEAQNANPDLWAHKDIEPLQYLYEAADCRMFYTVETALSRTAQWKNAANQAFGFNGTQLWSGCVEGSYGHNSSLSGDEKLFNGGQPVNVTDFHPANVGDGNVDVSVFDLKGNAFLKELNSTSSDGGPNASGTKTGAENAVSHTGTQNAGVRKRAGIGMAMGVAGALGVMMMVQ